MLAATQGQNPARQVSVGAGLSESVPAGQASILCGSGMKSILDGARAIRAGGQRGDIFIDNTIIF